MKTKIIDSITSIMQALVKWAQNNVDFAFVLAAFTETPRWTVAFKAIHEPTWIGIPLGILLAFATARAWRRYFEEPSNRWLLAFNVASVVIAVAVIAPVLYALAGIGADAKADVDIVLSKALSPFWLGVWSVLLAVTTFSPLIQLAAVTDILKPDTKPEVQPSKKVTRTAKTTQTVELSEQVVEEQQPVQFSVVEPVQIEVNPQNDEQPVQIDLASLSTEQKKVYALQAMRAGKVNMTKLAEELKVQRPRLYEWKAELTA